MKITEIPLKDLKPYENNPRLNDLAVPKVAESLKRFGWQQPIVIDRDNVIVCGHTRYKAALSLGMETAPCKYADELTQEEIDAYRLADNKTAEFASWDAEKVTEEIMKCGDIDMKAFGFSDEDITGEIKRAQGEYSKKIKIPQYEPIGLSITLDDCADTKKTDELIAEIKAADIPGDVKHFLIEAAHRHTVFNYRNIAEFYAKATPEVQRLMEKSALVIIDIDDAIANGYVKLTKEVESLIGDQDD